MQFNRNFYRHPAFYIDLIIVLWCTGEFFTTRLWSLSGIMNLIIWLLSLAGLWEVLAVKATNH